MNHQCPVSNIVYIHGLPHQWELSCVWRYWEIVNVRPHCLLAKRFLYSMNPLINLKVSESSDGLSSWCFLKSECPPDFHQKWGSYRLCHMAYIHRASLLCENIYISDSTGKKWKLSHIPYVYPVFLRIPETHRLCVLCVLWEAPSEMKDQWWITPGRVFLFTRSSMVVLSYLHIDNLLFDHGVFLPIQFFKKWEMDDYGFISVFSKRSVCFMSYKDLWTWTASSAAGLRAAVMETVVFICGCITLHPR
jgi:hypothetical protein